MLEFFIKKIYSYKLSTSYHFTENMNGNTKSCVMNFYVLSYTSVDSLMKSIYVVFAILFQQILKCQHCSSVFTIYANALDF